MGMALLRRLEMPSDPTDVDLFADLGDLGERVVAAPDNMSCRLSPEELREQMALMSAVDTALQMPRRKSGRCGVFLWFKARHIIDEWSDKDGH